MSRQRALAFLFMAGGAAYFFLNRSSSAATTGGSSWSLPSLPDLSGTFGTSAFGETPPDYQTMIGADPSQGLSGDPVPDYSGYQATPQPPLDLDEYGNVQDWSQVWGGSGPYDALIQQASTRYGVRAEVIAGVIRTESGGNPTARNPTTSARGLMQMTKAAAADVGADWNALDDPATAIDAGTAYLAIQINRFGEADGVRAYYAGAGTVSRGTNTTLLSAADDYLDKVFG